MESSPEYKQFLKALHAAMWNEASKLATKYKLDNKLIKEAAHSEYNSCMDSKKFEWALDIADRFLEEKEQKPPAEILYKKKLVDIISKLVEQKQEGFNYFLSRDVRGFAEFAEKHGLENNEIMAAVELEYFVYIRSNLGKSALSLAKKFNLSSYKLKIAKEKPQNDVDEAITAWEKEDEGSGHKGSVVVD